jgi:hypothetical protein
MPLFHFNSRTGGTMLPDLQGEDLPDIETARTVAISTAREALLEAVKFGDTPKPGSCAAANGISIRSLRR